MEDMEIGVLILLIIVGIALFTSVFTVEQQTCAIIERFGKFYRIAGPGLNILIPLIDQI
jgi:regulator of protease activity HflC (stomatin/prohibitin superfamily)